MPPRVRLFGPLRFNPTGYDREVLHLLAGEQVASAELAAFVARNPDVGEVLADAARSPVTAPKPKGARVK